MRIPLNRFFVLSVALTSIACSGQVVTATRAQPDSGDAGAEDSAPPDEAGLDATPETMWGDAEASVWGDAAACPLFACVTSDEYFPAEPLIRAEDVEPGLRFLRVSQGYVLANRSVNGVDEPAVVRIPLGGEPAQLITAFTGVALHPKAIAAGRNEPQAFGVLVCSDNGCEVLVPSEDESDVIVPHPAGTVPVPGQPDTLVMVTLEEPSLCVLGDGASCIQSGVWRTWIEPGSGPRIRAMAAGYDRVMFVGDGGRVISFGAEGRKDEVIDPTQDLTHVVFGGWDRVVVLGQGQGSTIWSSAGDGWSSCSGAFNSDVFVLSAVNGTLHGVRGFGNPFKEMMHDEQLYWMDACPFEDESFHGELIDGDVFLCAAGINYLGLQPDALLGTANCPLGT
jgi:hypothetical protein